MTAMKQSTHKSSPDSNKSPPNLAGDFQTERDTDRYLHMHAKLKAFEEIETDQESGASSEDMESPTSVFSSSSSSKMRKWPVLKNLTVRVHSQILRIREEDSHLGEDVFGEYCLIGSGRDKISGHEYVDALLFSTRRSLPASPLRGKTNIN